MTNTKADGSSMSEATLVGQTTSMGRTLTRYISETSDDYDRRLDLTPLR